MHDYFLFGTYNHGKTIPFSGWRKDSLYYLTIEKNGEEVCARLPYSDYSEAMLACAEHYRSTTKRSVLTFTTETINGRFARSYAEMNRPEEISTEDEMGKIRYAVAAKYTNAFEFEKSLFFLIETDVGIEDVDGWLKIAAKK